MSEPVISVRGLGKKYKLGATLSPNTLRDHIAQSAKSLFSQIYGNRQGNSPLPNDARHSTLVTSASRREFWALRDVSFDVQQGEVMGIIGRNGAGKTTLLKILSQITEPTEGEVRIRGRVASLLEVGTGFHAELSGRENIFMNGAILGMTRMEIKRKFDEIVEFAGVDRFIDTPVKRYSSGMKVRLAFAVAAHLEPDILLVDEVLAVGDAVFQKKCLGKMGDVTKEGRTVLFVSHNMSAVQQLCSTGLLIEEGAIAYLGATEKCIDRYLKSASNRQESIVSHAATNDLAVKLHNVTVNGSTNDRQNLPIGCKQLDIIISGSIDRPMPLLLEARIYDLREQCLAFFTPRRVREHFEVLPEGRFCLTESIGLPHLNQGEYILSLYISEYRNQGKSPIRLDKALHLEAEGTPTVTGWVFRQARGNGWMLLPEAEPSSDRDSPTLSATDDRSNNAPREESSTVED